MGHFKDICNLGWNVALCNMKIMLKQLRESTWIFRVKIVLKVFKTIPKGPFVDKCGMRCNVNLKESKKSSRSWSGL